MNKDVDINHFISLHKYFIMAAMMKDDFQAYIKNNASVINEPRHLLKASSYMSLWYAELYVVIEGWKELNLDNQFINHLLTDEELDLLRKFRNGIFHYQKEYIHENKIMSFINNDKSVTWVLLLHERLSTWFAENLKKLKGIPSAL